MKRAILGQVGWAKTRVALPEVSMPAAPAKRRRGATDGNQWALDYFPERYYYPSAFHLEFWADLQRVILGRGVQKTSRAAPRGLGKTTLTWLAALWAALYGHRNVIVLMAKKQANAEDRLETIKDQIRTNQHLAEDFPEHAGWVARFGGDPRLCPAGYKWARDEIKLPNGAWIVARGLDGAVPGLIRDGRRPDLVIFDDPEDAFSVRSPAESAAIEAGIRTTCYLHEVGGNCGYVMVTTIRAPGSISDRYTDPAREPAWRGKRYRALVAPPTDSGLWKAFREHCRQTAEPLPSPADDAIAQAAAGISAEEWKDLPPGTRSALRIYGAHRAAMDAGARLIDDRRFRLWELEELQATPEGVLEFRCERQNDPPPPETAPVVLSTAVLRECCTGGPEGVVPEWASYLTLAVDCGLHRLHWEIDAWPADGAMCAMIACGVEDTAVDAGAQYAVADEATRPVLVETALTAALTRIADRADAGWRRGPEVLVPRVCGADVGGQAGEWAWYESVLKFCASRAGWLGLKGQAWSHPVLVRAGGKNWICEQGNNPYGRIDANPDHYKSVVYEGYTKHTRLLHAAAWDMYLAHQVAEEKDPLRGKWEYVRNARGKRVQRPNHFFDTAWMATCLAEIVRVANAAEHGTHDPKPAHIHVPTTGHQPDALLF